MKQRNHHLTQLRQISVLSIGLSSVYGGSRTLMSLAETGYAPSVFAYVDKSGRPLWALVFILAFGTLAYVNLTTSGAVVFNWLLALSGLSTLFTWGTICLCHVRFRKAWKVQGHSIEELPFRAMFGAWGSWAGLILVILVLIAQFYIAVSPLQGMSSDPSEVATTFFQAYLALPVVVLFYVIGYAWKRTTPQRAHQIDLDVSRLLFFACSQFCSGPIRGGVLTALLKCMVDRSQVLVHCRTDARLPRRACCPAHIAEGLPHPLLELTEGPLHILRFLLQLPFMSMHAVLPR
jgi:amino acid transporter